MATNNATNTSNPATVAQGGTGNSSATAYALQCGGTTSTGAHQSVSGVGTSGQVLTSNGAGALPTWQTASSGAGVKAYVSWNGTGSSSTNATIYTSSGVTSVFKNAGADFTITWTNAFSTTSYAVAGGGQLDTSSGVASRGVWQYSTTPSASTLRVFTGSTGGAADIQFANIIACGT